MSDQPTEGNRPLNRLFKMAVLAGVDDSVRLHIQRGDDINACDDKGLIPLMIAASRNRASTCRLLLDSGADARLLNAAGLDALTLAKLAGAHDAAKILESALAIGYERSGDPLESWDAEPGASITAIGTNVEIPAPPVATSPRLLESDPGGSTLAQAHPDEPLGYVETDGLARGAIAAANQQVDGEPEPTDATQNGEAGFDLTGWEAEVERPAPQDDLALAQEAAAVQDAISNHAPIDKSEDWNDFDVLLPERATPLLRSEDAETRAELRLLLLRAIREGSVPQACVDDLCRGDDQDLDQAAESRLHLVINDLGAETDERIEYIAPSESFAVHVEPDETPDAEAIAVTTLLMPQGIDRCIWTGLPKKSPLR